MKKITVAALLLFLAAGCNKSFVQNAPQENVTDNSSDQQQSQQAVQEVPVSRAAERVTKKPFGIYVTPQNSPVQPERFTGYHTGVDFETFPEEQGKDVQVYAICDGKILAKSKVGGYGGVIVQSCNLESQDVTVVYGHLNIGSSGLSSGDFAAKGAKIALLGEKGPDTDNERKHLHLGIHKGTAVDLRGYVQKQSDLSNWIDYKKLANL